VLGDEAYRLETPDMGTILQTWNEANSEQVQVLRLAAPIRRPISEQIQLL